MNNVNKLPSITETPAEEVDDRPDYVKKIESFDIDNITPENIQFMINTVQDYFLEHFPVKPELVNELPDRFCFMDEDEYVEKATNGEYGEKGYVDFNIRKTQGYYNQKENKIYMNKSIFKNVESLFSSIFHESLHYTSIRAGAGFSGNFLQPVPDENDPLSTPEDVCTGLRALDEGTVQFITLHSVVDNMGFEPKDGMYGYDGERNVMQSIWDAFPPKTMLHLYFETPIDDIRLYIEKTFEPKETRDTITREWGNGVFCDCLRNLGIASRRMNKALNKFVETGDRTEPDEILSFVKHALGHYIVNDCMNNDVKLSDDDKEYLKEYLEPFADKDGKVNI